MSLDGKDRDLPGPGHPSMEALLALTGEAPAPGEAPVDPKWMEHVGACPTCSELFRELKEWRDAVRYGDAGNAPEAWVRRAEEHAVPRSFLGPLLGKIRADVVFDSILALAPGTRHDPLQGRQWIVAGDRLEIEISTSPAGSSVPPGLSGQVMQVEGAPVKVGDCRIILMQGGEDVSETMTRATGEFLVADRPSGAFQVRLEGDGWSLLTPLLEP
jgi:hypothetical protein